MKPNIFFNVNVKDIVKKIIDLSYSKEDLIKLAKNFVYYDYDLINFDESDSDFKIMKYKGDCYYSKETNSLKALKTGFVNYTYYNIEILDPYFVTKDKNLLLLYLPKYLDKINLHKLAEEIKSLNISNYDEEKVLGIIKPGIYVLAKGTKPIHGHSEQIFPVIEEKVLHGKMDENGNINFYEKNFICNVNKGQIVAKVIPEQKPVDGWDLYGNRVPAKYFEKKIFSIGEGIEKKGNSFYSAINGGIFTSKNNILRVLKIYKIVGNLSLKTGNIYANGSLVVIGDIEEGIKIDVKGDLYVTGGIFQPAELNVDGNLICLKGFNGKKEKQYYVHGDFYSEFIINSNLVVCGSIMINREISNSKIFCFDNIFCYKMEGTILASQIYVNNIIIANFFGRKNSGRNNIYLGYSKNIFEIERKLSQLAVEKKELEKYNNKKELKNNNLLIEQMKLEREKILEKNINYKSHLIALKVLCEDNFIFNIKKREKIKNPVENSIVYYEKDFDLKIEPLYYLYKKKVLEMGDKYYEIRKFREKLDLKKIISKSVLDFLKK